MGLCPFIRYKIFLQFTSEQLSNLPAAGQWHSNMAREWLGPDDGVREKRLKKERWDEIIKKGGGPSFSSANN